VFAALADPTRRAFVERLALGEATVSDLASAVPISLPAVSRHLRVLEQAGLVVRDKRGRTTWCALAPSALDSAADWLARTRSFWSANLDGLAAYLEDP
jgi:DNA-binding transcriptional ArsR family regulator